MHAALKKRQKGVRGRDKKKRKRPQPGLSRAPRVGKDCEGRAQKGEQRAMGTPQSKVQSPGRLSLLNSASPLKKRGRPRTRADPMRDESDRRLRHIRYCEHLLTQHGIKFDAFQ